MSQQRSHIPKEIEDAVYARDGRACVDCGSTKRLTMGHKIAHSEGGPITVENLKVQCGPCNQNQGPMGRPRLDPNDETVRLTLRLPKRLTDDIDRMRGKATRSEYIRTMIEATVGLIAPIELKFETKPMPEKPARRIYVEPIKVKCEHTKGWKRGNIFDTCVECGETKRH